MLLLHVSDIHFRSPDCLDRNFDPDRPYRTRMLQDVRALVAALGPVDAILLGGDIAFKGAPDEYQTAMKWIGELVSAARCHLERVFTVPGNHDVDRGFIRRTPATRNAQAAIAGARPAQREREFRTQITDGDTARSLVGPLTAYNDFATPFNCQVYLPDHLCWKQNLALEDGVVLRLHGLTSTLLSAANGSGDARESLYLSPLQTVLDPLDDVVNLVLCHHPPDWFMDQDDAEDAICCRAAIQMFGHKHRQRITQEAGYVRFSAGALNPDRNEKGWQPGYNLVRVRVIGSGRERRLTIDSNLRQWQSTPDQFRPMLTPQGQDVFRHSIPFPSTPRSLGPAAASAVVTSASETATVATTRDVVTARRPERDREAAMGDANTRNMVFRFWNLASSERREIALALGLISAHEIRLPEPERYGRGLLRAGEPGQLAALAREIAKRETK